MAKEKMDIVLCPCGLNQSYDQCCGRFHDRQQWASTPELLMRSRYSAYVLNHQRYLLETWHATTRPITLVEDAAVKWRRLVISKSFAGTGDEAFVEFSAWFLVNGGKAQKMRELSRFIKEAGTWLYIDGIVVED